MLALNVQEHWYPLSTQKKKKKSLSLEVLYKLMQPKSGHIKAM